MSNADRSIWQFPKNEADKVLGWRSDGKGMENKGPFATPADLAGKQDASANLTTLAGITPGAVGQTILADVDGSDTADAVIAAPSVLRARALDQLFLTDPSHMGTVTATEFRDGLNPDITQELIDADVALAEGGLMNIPNYNGKITGTVTKKPSTQWVAEKSTIFGTWTCQFNGNIIEMIGNNLSRDGRIDGLRMLSNNATYPLAKAIYSEKVFTHKYFNLRIGGFNYGIEEKSTVATQGANLYIFDCLTDGHYVWSDPLDGDPATHSSDHRFYDCQWTGNRYGFHAEHAHSIKMTAARPQVGGVANLRINECNDFQFNGGFIDGSIANAATGGGHGALIQNCDRPIFIGVGFINNGKVGDPTKSHVSIFASEPMRGPVFGLCTFKDDPTAAARGITFSTPSGTGAYRHGRILGNDFSQCATPLVSLQNIGRDWQIDRNNGVSTFQNISTNPATAQTITAGRKVVRITGQNNNIDVIMPGAGHHSGQVVEVWFESGSGTITIRQPDGTTSLGTMTFGNRKSFICTSESDTVTSATFA